MATKLGRMMIYLEGLLTIKPCNPVTTWSCIVTWQKKSLYLHYQSAYGHQTWQDGNLPWRAPTHKVICLFDHVVLRDDVTYLNYYIFNATVPMATKLDRMSKHLEGLLTIKSFISLITWSCKVTWQIKTIIYPLPECLWLPNVTEWWLTLMGSYL